MGRRHRLAGDDDPHLGLEPILKRIGDPATPENHDQENAEQSSVGAILTLCDRHGAAVFLGSVLSPRRNARVGVCGSPCPAFESRSGSAVRHWRVHWAQVCYAPVPRRLPATLLTLSS